MHVADAAAAAEGRPSSGVDVTFTNAQYHMEARVPDANITIVTKFTGVPVKGRPCRCWWKPLT